MEPTTQRKPSLSSQPSDLPRSLRKENLAFALRESHERRAVFLADPTLLKRAECLLTALLLGRIGLIIRDRDGVRVIENRNRLGMCRGMRGIAANSVAGRLPVKWELGKERLGG